MKTINWYFKKGQLIKDNEIKELAQKFFQKARNNLVTMNSLFNLNNN